VTITERSKNREDAMLPPGAGAEVGRRRYSSIFVPRAG